jgi:hypothetical protein
VAGADDAEAAGDTEPDADDKADGAAEADGAVELDAEGPADSDGPTVSEGTASDGIDVSTAIEGFGVDGFRKPPFPNASAAKMIAPKITKMSPTQILSTGSSM